eukprot:65142_1
MSEAEWTQKTDFTGIDIVGYEIDDGTVVQADITWRTANKIFITFANGYQWIDIPNNRIRSPNSIQIHDYRIPTSATNSNINNIKCKVSSCSDCSKTCEFLIYERCIDCVSKILKEKYSHAIKSVHGPTSNFAMDIVGIIVDFTPKITCIMCKMCMDYDYNPQNINEVKDKENDFPKFRCDKCDVQYWLQKGCERMLREDYTLFLNIGLCVTRLSYDIYKLIKYVPLKSKCKSNYGGHFDNDDSSFDYSSESECDIEDFHSFWNTVFNEFYLFWVIHLCFGSHCEQYKTNVMKYKMIGILPSLMQNMNKHENYYCPIYW